MGVEIERKFLLAEQPGWLADCESSLIEQGYLALEQEGEVRLRLIDGGERAQLTIKRGHGRVRGETEIELSDEQARQLWPLTEGRRVTKRRYLAERGPGTWEIDVYEGPLAGLITAEIELESEAAAVQLEPPLWLGPELTGDQRFENRSLAERGRPGADPGP